MVNIVIFAGTVIGLLAAWMLFRIWRGRGAPSWKKIATTTLILAFLFMPFNIHGNVWTIFGNGTSKGDMYSIASVYKKATDDTVSIVTIGYETAGDNCMSGLLAGVQQCGTLNEEDAFGVAASIVGFALYQKASSVSNIMGISGYQEATKGTALTALGFSVYQKASSLAFHGAGISGYQEGYETAITLGVSGYQKAVEKARSMAAMTLYQKVKHKTRTFVIFSTFTAGENNE